MAEKDTSEKLLADYNDIFADIMNVLLFGGRRVVLEQALENTKDKSMYKADKRIHEQERDLSKIWKDENVILSIFGMENQTRHDPALPLRIIGYDGASYRKQLLGKKKKRLYPVITVVLNFGKNRWNRHKKLSDCLEVPAELLPYFSDYKILVFDIAYLTDEQLAQFQSDFKIVADYFVQMRRNKSYTPSRQKMKHVDEVLKLMSVLSNDERFEQVNQSGRRVENMCEALDFVENRGRAQGLLEGRKEGRREGLMAGKIIALYEIAKMKPEEIADILKLSLEEVDAVIENACG